MYPYNQSLEKELTSATKKAEDKIGDTILEMLVEAMTDEATDAEYYGQMIETVKYPEDKELIRSIKLNELKHLEIFQKIYSELSQQEPPKILVKAKPLSANATENFYKSILSELAGVEFYRKLYFMFLDLGFRDALFEVITDEQGHASKLNYLYAKYKA